jgi:outer membrane receptor protein involved in Fe transport
MQKLTRVLVFSLLLLSLAVAAFGQTESGQIAGTVKDKTGAVVANAKVTVTAVDTNVSRTGTTNASGIYTFPALKPAAYKVTIEAAGFQKFERRLEVYVSSNNDVSAVLSVLGSATVVEVSAEAASVNVNTENSTISTVITTSDLENLPTDANRNPYALVGQTSNATDDTNSGRGAGMALNGARSASTSILLDGAENVNAFTATVGQTVPLDSVQEFSVLTSNFGAEFGRASGGVVNLVTKSGTNHLHGSAYEFNRISALSSNTFYNVANDIARGHYTRNNFGFSIGGPIIKDKLFFFDNLEWIRVRSAAPVNAEIIDPASVSLLGAASQTYFGAYGTLASGVKTLNTHFCNTTGHPGNNLTCDLVSYNTPVDAGGGTPENTWDEVGKIDYNLSAKTTLTGRYAGYHEIDTAGSVNNSPYAGYNTGQNIFNQNVAISLTHIFSPRVVSSSKIVYNRMYQLQPLGSAPIAPTLYTNANLSSGPSSLGITQPLQFPGYAQLTPGNTIPFGGPQNLYQLYQDFSVTWNKHQIKFGGQYIQLRDNRIFGAYENAVEYLGKSTYDQGLTGILAGTGYQFQGAVNPQGEYPCYRDPALGTYIQTAACTLTLPVGAPSFERNYRYNDGAAYVQDTYKASNRLTLNAGLRWEYYGVQHNADPSKDSNFVMGPGATIFDRIRNGQVELAKNGGVFWKPNFGNFGPRAGFAWDPTGTGKTSLRGGYSISFERNFGNVTFNAIQNPPNYAVISITSNVDVPYTLPVYTNNAGPLAGTGTKAFPAASLRAINQNLHTAYLESWNLTLEQKVFNNALFTIAYTGSHGVHDYSISNANVAGISSYGIAGDGGTFLGDSGIASNGYNAVANRLNQQYSNMNYRSSDAYSHYNALVTTFKANNIHKTGVNAYVTYQWSHTLDNLSSTFSDGVATTYAATGYLDTWNPKLNYGNADYDIRHRVVSNASWDLPWFKNSSNAVEKYALSGWIVAGTFSLRSGNPYTIWDCDNQLYDCPFYTPGAGAPKLPKGSTGASQGGGFFDYQTLPMDPNPNPITGVPGGYAYGLANALGIPTCAGLYHQGCVYTLDGTKVPDRNQFQGPKVWNTNLQILKNFKFYEKYGLQFRAEFYNLINHHNQYIYQYGLDVSGSQQGTPYAITTIKGGSGSSSDDHRNVDLGVRFSF